MKLSKLALLGLASLIPATSAIAHNPLSDPEWCTSGSRLVIVDEFDWSGAQLERMRARREDESCTADGDGTRSGGDRICGQFDDDWLQAYRLSTSHCSQFTVNHELATRSDHGAVVPIATGPAEFLDEEFHHELYDLGMGLHGACVRCDPEPIRPLPPVKQRW
jgi:hypothetical protein